MATRVAGGDGAEMGGRGKVVTALTDKPITRRVSSDQGRVQLVITVSPNGLLSFRESGARKSYTISAMTCYAMAVKQNKGD